MARPTRPARWKHPTWVIERVDSEWRPEWLHWARRTSFTVDPGSAYQFRSEEDAQKVVQWLESKNVRGPLYIISVDPEGGAAVSEALPLRERILAYLDPTVGVPLFTHELARHLRVPRSLVGALCRALASEGELIADTTRFRGRRATLWSRA